MDLKYFDWAKHQALMRPNKVAIKDYYSGEQLTYLELEQRALKIAAYFQKKKIGSKDRVALLSKNNSIFLLKYYREGFYLLVWEMIRLFFHL